MSFYLIAHFVSFGVVLSFLMIGEIGANYTLSGNTNPLRQNHSANKVSNYALKYRHTGQKIEGILNLIPNSRHFELKTEYLQPILLSQNESRKGNCSDIEVVDFLEERSNRDILSVEQNIFSNDTKADDKSSVDNHDSNFRIREEQLPQSSTMCSHDAEIGGIDKDRIDKNAENNGLSEMYSWVENFRLKEMVDNEWVLVIDKIECSEEGNFFVVSIGNLLTNDNNDLGREVTVVRKEMYALNHYPGASGDPATRHIVENSIDPTDYWCVPKQEFCFERIKFGNFGINVRKGRAEIIPIDRVYNLRLGMVSAIQLAVVERCSDTISLYLRREMDE